MTSLSDEQAMLLEDLLEACANGASTVRVDEMAKEGAPVSGVKITTVCPDKL